MGPTRSASLPHSEGGFTGVMGHGAQAAGCQQGTCGPPCPTRAGKMQPHFGLQHLQTRWVRLSQMRHGCMRERVTWGLGGMGALGSAHPPRGFCLQDPKLPPGLTVLGSSTAPKPTPHQPRRLPTEGDDLFSQQEARRP